MLGLRLSLMLRLRRSLQLRLGPMLRLRPMPRPMFRFRLSLKLSLKLRLRHSFGLGLRRRRGLRRRLKLRLRLTVINPGHYPTPNKNHLQAPRTLALAPILTMTVKPWNPEPWLDSRSKSGLYIGYLTLTLSPVLIQAHNHLTPGRARDK